MVVLLALLAAAVAWGLRQLARAQRLIEAQSVRAQVAEQSLRDLDRDLRAAQADLKDWLGDRLAQAQRTQGDAAQALRETLLERHAVLQQDIVGRLGEGRLQQQRALAELQEQMRLALAAHNQSFAERQTEALKLLQDSLSSGMHAVQRQVTDALMRNAEELTKRVEALTQTTEVRLKDISGQVEQRLSEGFAKTTETFTSVLNHLTRIDEAQKRITELSSSVVSLQEVLADKRSRGAFGEVQLAGLVRNVLPERTFALQHSLPNGARVDCMLFLPEPTGHVAVDAKFPLENYQRMADMHAGEMERKEAERRFRADVRKHIQDIAEKYIIPGTTSDGAVMFVPAEAVFAEIHARYPDLVEEGQRRRVWMVSPTTLMAILTTARAVLKDAATREQVHIIQKHLVGLSKDFDRFHERMEKLARHMLQAGKDVEDVQTSARRITAHFRKIEGVELERENVSAVPGLGSEEPPVVALNGP